MPSLETSIMVPMRDGVRLSMDLYFPDRPRRDLPVVLSRTPYDKRSFRAGAGDDRGGLQAEAQTAWRVSGQKSEAWRFAEAGFVYAIQDLRGTFESEGECKVSEFDRQDGFDTVQWLSQQPWSNGRVGTYGCSQRGEVQLQLAAERPPALKCLIAQAAASVMYGETSRSYLHMGGAVNLSICGWYRRWINTVRPQYPPGCDASLIRQCSQFHSLKPDLPPLDFDRDLQHLPIIDVLDKIGSPPSEWRELVSHAPADPWWSRKGHVTRHDQFDVPILHVNSWFDFGVHETLVFADMVRRNAASEFARRNQYVLISPTSHCESEKWREGDQLGEWILGPPDMDFFELYIQWLHHWLDSDQTKDFGRLPYVKFYMLGANSWRDSNTWPPEDAQQHTLFLDSKGMANGVAGDGRLSYATPTESHRDTFNYDPLAPVPTLGGPWAPGEPPTRPFGATDQSDVQARDDVLVYTSGPIPAALELAGPITALLHICSTAPDTDFTAKLTLVTKSGKAIWLAEGILRARYRYGFDQPKLLTAGEIATLQIDMKATAVLLPEGSKLRLEITSSSFPRFERNLNTGGRNFDEAIGQVACNTVVHSPEHPSALTFWARPHGRGVP